MPLCCAICGSTSHQYGLEGDKFLSHAPVFTYSFSAFRILLPGSNLSAQTISSPKPPYLSDARKSEVGEFAYTECRAPQRFWKLFLRRVVQPPGFSTHNIKAKERAQQRVFVHIRGQHLGTLFAGGDKGVWAAGSECLHSSWGEEALTHLCLERSSPCPLYLA